MTRSLFGLVVLVSPAVAGPVEVGGAKLEVVAAPESAEFMLGEPGFVGFKVCNPSKQPLGLAVGGDYRNRLGRPDSFKVEVVGPDGKAVPQPDAGSSMGGMCWSEKLPAEGSHTFRLFVPHWATFEKPGTYTVTIRRKLTVEAVGVGKVGEAEAVAKTTVKIVPADAVKMGRMIDQLGKLMLDRSSDRAEEAEKMLAAVHDDRVVPYFAALAKKPHFSPRFAAARSLGKYKSDEAFEALKQLAKTTGTEIRASATTMELAESSAAGVRHAAVHAIGDSPHPKAVATLWTFAADPSYAVRVTVLHKAAEVKSAEARTIITKMTADANETVRNEAKRYQKLLGGLK
jgi:hypothetical protein